MMIIGVTGSRHGRPIAVIEQLRGLLQAYGAIELHHGDCEGFDMQAFTVAKQLHIKTVAHPPTDDTWRAHTHSDVILPSAPYLIRNRAIVDACDMLIAAPNKPEGPAGHPCGGTWYTVRRARAVGRHMTVLEGVT